MKLVSLFDGSGGFPLAGSMCGIEPTFASEVEPYPIAVTTSRFPRMKHLGNVTKINGAEIEPVDVITFGSPCQDLSIAGKRAGLKHEDNGDEETTRSGLFMEAVRIIKEMRRATNGVYPRFAVWENVFGAFSSNKGEDFKIVLEEIVKVVEPTAEMPPMPKGGWAYADIIVGDGWSIAYRTYDAQYWGVPQRRRRIYLVADFRGECAGEISFKRESVRGYFAEGRTPWQGTAGDAENGTGTDDSKGKCYGEAGRRDVVKCYDIGEARLRTPCEYNEVAPTITARCGTGGNNVPAVVTYDARRNGDGKTVNTLIGDHENRVTDYTAVVCIQDSAENKKQNGRGWCEDTAYTLDTFSRPAVVYAVDQGGGKSSCNVSENKSPTLTCTHGGEPVVSYQEKVGTLCCTDYKWVQQQQVEQDKLIVEKVAQDEEMQYIVRRLTPTECARLQGFPDKWGHPDKKSELTDEEYKFWFEVRKTDAEINGKQVKEWTKPQILAWYNKLHTDSSEYKMWGNGIALPNALYVMQGIAEVLQRG